MWDAQVRQAAIIVTQAEKPDVPPKTLSGMTRGWAYGNEAANGRVS